MARTARGSVDGDRGTTSRCPGRGRRRAAATTKVSTRLGVRPRRRFVHLRWAFENFRQNTSLHERCRSDAINVKDGGSDVADAHWHAHDSHAPFDSRPHGDEQTRDVIAILEIVLGDDRRSSGVIPMCVTGFDFAEWLKAQRAWELDPLNVHARVGLGIALYIARRYDEAVKSLRETVMMAPHREAHFILGVAYQHGGNLPAAIAELEKAVKFLDRDPLHVAALGNAEACAGHMERARELLAELVRRSAKEYVTPSSRRPPMLMDSSVFPRFRSVPTSSLRNTQASRTGLRKTSKLLSALRSMST